MEIKKPITVICNNSDTNTQNELQEKYCGIHSVLLKDLQSWSVHKFMEWFDACSMETFKENGIEKVILFTMQEPMIDFISLKIIEGKINSSDVDLVFISSKYETTHFTIDLHGTFRNISDSMRIELLTYNTIMSKIMLATADKF
jgi:hypothetical protein